MNGTFASAPRTNVVSGSGAHMNETILQNRALHLFLALVTIAFIWILLPFYGAVFWAVILGILFAPLQQIGRAHV